MDVHTRNTRIAAGLTLVAALALTFGGIWAFGIWDPWELNAADVARRLAAGEPGGEDGAPLRSPMLSPWLVAQGFALFGVHEWAGRLPMALSGLLAVVIAMLAAWRFAGPRAGIYAAIVTTSSPLFLFNARQMLGAAPAMAAQALVFLCAASLVFLPGGRDPQRERTHMALWGVGLVLACGLSTLASGVLLGVLPPLGAVAGAALARGLVAGDWLSEGGAAVSKPQRFAAIGAVVITLGVALRVALLVAADADVYDHWIGGAPRGGAPPSFELAIEQVFHSFAPWSAIVPVAIGHALLLSERGQGPNEDEAPQEGALRLAAVLWAALGFTAQTIYISRFGSTTFLPVVALAIVVAFFLRDVERAGGGAWGAGLVVLLLSALVFRDFRGYPLSPADGLGLSDLTAPETFNPRGGWALILFGFGLLALLGMSAERDEDTTAFETEARLLMAPKWAGVGLLLLGWPGKLLQAQWARGPGFRAWMLFLGTLASGCTVYGILCFVVGVDERPYDTLRIAAIVLWSVAGLAWLTRLGVWVDARRRALGGRARVSVGVLANLVWLLGWSVAKLTKTDVESPSDEAQKKLSVATGWIVGVGTVSTASAIACTILAGPGVSSIAVRVGMVLAFLVPALVILTAAGRATRFFFAWLARRGGYALAPMLALGLVAGAYTSFRYQPQLSGFFSPREVYDTYNQLADEGEPLGEYRVGGRAATYYAHGEVTEISEQAEAISFLVGHDERRWLAFRADDLANLNRLYRQRAGRHLFVADARSERVLLASSEPVPGVESQNYLAETVLDAPPADIQHRVHVSFDRRIELLGYDLELPNGSTVGPGQTFAVTWYWRCLAPVQGSYQLFLHIDGAGQRLNGDHEPVEGRYPVRLWEEGDVVVDRQELSVPGNFPPGAYVFNIGFFAGESRLEIVEGPEDDADRARAGTLIVR